MKKIIYILLGILIILGITGCVTTQTQANKKTIVAQNTASNQVQMEMSCGGNGENSAMGICPCGCGTSVPKALLTAADTAKVDSCCGKPEEKKNEAVKE